MVSIFPVLLIVTSIISNTWGINEGAKKIFDSKTAKSFQKRSLINQHGLRGRHSVLISEKNHHIHYPRGRISPVTTTPLRIIYFFMQMTVLV